MIKFTATKDEMKLIKRIADRAYKKYKDVYESKMDILMDIEATHCNGCTLDLKELLDADDFNFFHDIGGIAKHLNRETGKIENCFLPRFAA